MHKNSISWQNFHARQQLSEEEHRAGSEKHQCSVSPTTTHYRQSIGRAHSESGPRTERKLLDGIGFGRRGGLAAAVRGIIVRRARLKVAGWIGIAIALFAGWLGGELVYRLNVRRRSRRKSRRAKFPLRSTGGGKTKPDCARVGTANGSSVRRVQTEVNRM